MKKLILALLFVPLLASAQMMPQQGGTGSSLAPTIGQVLVGLSTGKYTPQATSTLGLMGFAYASSTFPTFTYSSTTYPTFTYATNTFATIASLASYVTFTYATATFPSFTYATNTYYFASNPSGYITNSVSNLTNYPTYTYASSSYVKVIDTQSIAGAKTFSGTTTLATTTVTNFSASGMVGVATTTPTNQVTVASGTIAVLEYDWGSSTSTTMTVDWKKANTQKMNISTSAVTITFINGTTTPGAQLMLFICNAPSGTAGAITFTHVYWPSATMPTQTTTANNCDLWSFKSTYSTSSNIIIGAQTAKF